MASQSLLTFAFRMRPSEYFRAWRDFGRFALNKGAARRRSAFIFLCLFIVVGWLWRTDHTFPVAIFVWPAVVIVALVVFVLASNRAKASRQGVHVRDQVRVLNERGLLVQNVHVVEMPWASMPQAVETAEFFLFYKDARSGHYLPKRAITSENDLRLLREFISGCLGARFRGAT